MELSRDGPDANKEMAGWDSKVHASTRSSAKKGSSTTGIPAQQDREKITKHNAAFVEYYQHQKIVSEETWDAFYASLKMDLPTAFRIVEKTPHTSLLLETILTAQTTSVLENLASRNLVTGPICVIGLIGESCACIASFVVLWLQVSGYHSTPGMVRWELAGDESLVQRVGNALEFHRFLVNQSEAGTLFRQEAVSMIPALFLPIRKQMGDKSGAPAHRVLDMCAAPGSKTSQIVEFLNEAEDGVVVANDINSKRAHMLIHHLRHLDSTTLVVTNHSAHLYPNVFVGTQSALQKLQYSAILCDVPCSGDGTMRKSQILWRDWTPSRSLTLHRLQLNILKRALQLCAVGGTVVYSTCSFNPLENEAVVNAALACCGPGIEVVDVSTEAKSLPPHAQGLTSWEVYWNRKWYSNLEELPLQKKALQRVTPSMFPHCRRQQDREKDALKFLRFLPHLSNTGGFFIAVLKKVKEVYWTPLIDPRRTNADRGCSLAYANSCVSTAEGVRSVSGEKCDGADTALFETDDEEERGAEIAESEHSDISVEGNDDLEDSTSLVKNSCPGVASGILEFSNGSAQLPLSSGADTDHPARPEILLKPQKDLISVGKLGEMSEINVEEWWEKLGAPYGLQFPSPSILQQLFIRTESLRNPRKVWFSTTAAAEMINAVFRTPLKVLSAGCLTFDGKHSSHFRMTSSGIRWLDKAGLTAPRDEWISRGPRIAVISRSLLGALLQEAAASPRVVSDPVKSECPSENSKPDPQWRFRHRFEDLPKDDATFGRLESLPSEHPCVLLCAAAERPNGDCAGPSVSTDIAVCLKEGPPAFEVLDF